MRLPHLLLILALVPVTSVRAQSQAPDGEVFLARELAHPPRLQGNRVLYFPADSFSRKVRVRVQFVVDTIGLPVPGSLRVTEAPDSSFAEATRMTVLARHYLPGTFRGNKIRVLMEDRITFKPTARPCNSLIDAHGQALCVDSLGQGD